MSDELLENYLEDLKSGKAVLIDVRERIEYEKFHVEGSILWPLSEIEGLDRSQLTQYLSAYQNKHLYLHCRSGTRVFYAIDKLKELFSPLIRVTQSPEQIQFFLETHKHG